VTSALLPPWKVHQMLVPYQTFDMPEAGRLESRTHWCEGGLSVLEWPG
jgi:hypothetical protein